MHCVIHAAEVSRCSVARRGCAGGSDAGGPGSWSGCFGRRGWQASSSGSMRPAHARGNAATPDHGGGSPRIMPTSIIQETRAPQGTPRPCRHNPEVRAERHRTYIWGDRLRPHRRDRVRQAGQPVADDHQHVAHTPILDLGDDVQPGTFAPSPTGAAGDRGGSPRPRARGCRGGPRRSPRARRRRAGWRPSRRGS